MAEKNLAQHIDKISYAVAAVVGLIVLVLPVLSGGNIAATRTRVNELVENLENKKTGQIFPVLPDRQLKNEVQDQWNPGSNVTEMNWVTEAAPGLHRQAKSAKLRPATHAPGVIAAVSAHRDPARKQVFLVVKGAVGAGNEFVVIDSMELYRRAGADGEFTPLELRASGGSFEYKDYEVKPGQTYTYKFKTVASRDPAAPTNIQAPDHVERESAEAGPTPPVPYDFSLRLRQIIPARQLGEVPEAFADFSYWDYEKEEIVRARGSTRYKEKDVIGNGRYLIRRLEADSREKSMTVKDNVTQERFDIKTKDTPFEIELWPPISGLAVETSSTLEESVADSVEPEPEVEKSVEAPADTPAPRPPSRTRRRRSFGE